MTVKMQLQDREAERELRGWSWQGVSRLMPGSSWRGVRAEGQIMRTWQNHRGQKGGERKVGLDTKLMVGTVNDRSP